MSKMQKRKVRKPGMNTAYDIMEAILPFTHEWIRPGYFDDLVKKLEIENVEAQIYFLTSLYHNVRLWPERLFPEPENRAKLLEEIQLAIDNAIEAEEEMMEEEE